jgi:hypothetical protein
VSRKGFAITDENLDGSVLPVSDKEPNHQLPLETLRVREIGRRDPDLINQLRRNLITPAPGNPSVGEMLREDRDR